MKGRRFGFAMIAALTIAATVGIVAIVSGNFDDTDWRILGSVGAVALFSLTAMEGAALLRRDDPAAPLGGLGIIVSLLTLALSVGLIWQTGYDEDGTLDDWYRALSVGVTWSIALGHVSLLLSRRRESDGGVVTALVATAIGFVVGIATMLSIAMLRFDLDVSEGFWRALAVMAILAVLATILLPVTRRIQRRR
jgi:hypothetical protein